MTDDKETADERRRYKRHPFQVQIRYRATSGDTVTQHEARVDTIINISANGLLVEATEPLEVEQTVSLRFLQPNSYDFFEGSGRVVRVEPLADGKGHCLGIEFVGLSEEAHRMLDYYLSLG